MRRERGGVTLLPKRHTISCGKRQARERHCVTSHVSTNRASLLTTHACRRKRQRQNGKDDDASDWVLARDDDDGASASCWCVDCSSKLAPSPEAGGGGGGGGGGDASLTRRPAGPLPRLMCEPSRKVMTETLTSTLVLRRCLSTAGGIVGYAKAKSVPSRKFFARLPLLL